jgi:uncharacterized protein (TIGR04562 family)
MLHTMSFSEPVLNSVIGGKSSIDMPRLNIQTPAEATAFLKGYGYDIENETDQKKLWYFHRRALVFLEEKLGFSRAEVPEIIHDAKQLGDIRQLLLLASSSNPAERSLQKWACAVLRVMHVFVHTENDLFSSFTEEIQKQILSPFQSCIFNDGTSGQIFLRKHLETSSSTEPAQEEEPLSLLGFEVKPFKTSTSSVIKLLAKPDALAMSVYDKLGVRFVTHSMFDAYRVVRFMVEENLISFPHIMPDQSSNNLYPVDLFIEVITELKGLGRTLDEKEIDELFRRRMEERKHSVEFLRKENSYSGQEYRFIKFISRKLIKLQLPDNKGQFSFFFPYEVQIMDKEAHQKILSGPAEHQA